jgi:predicted nucleotidyltransferase
MVGPQPELDRRLDRLVQRLREAGGGNLLGVALYGGLVKGRYTPGVSDINVLVVEPERMDRISRLRRVDPRPDEATVRERMTELLDLLARIGRKVDGSAS